MIEETLRFIESEEVRNYLREFLKTFGGFAVESFALHLVRCSGSDLMKAAIVAGAMPFSLSLTLRFAA